MKICSFSSVGLELFLTKFCQILLKTTFIRTLVCGIRRTPLNLMREQLVFVNQAKLGTAKSTRGEGGI